jgi:hypothetical protein
MRSRGHAQPCSSRGRASYHRGGGQRTGAAPYCLSTAHPDAHPQFTWSGGTLKKIVAPTWEKAWMFLDDKLLPATSNTVEHGNRRHWKIYKSVSHIQS